ncbi:MAG: cell division protein FtsX [Bernardetiaceae bacterium]
MQKRIPSTAGQLRRMGSFPYLGVFINVSIALCVSGILGILGIYTFRLQSYIRENTPVRVFLRQDISETERLLLEKKLADYPFVARQQGQARLHFLSKDEAMRQEIERTGEDFSALIANPLPDSYFLHLDAEYYQSDTLTAIAQQIEALPGVKEVKVEVDFLAEINRNFAVLGYILGSFALVFFAAAIILIDNALRLALFSQRFLIRSMQLVGASAYFIMRPFIRQAIRQGAMAAGLSIVVTALLSHLTRNLLEAFSWREDLPWFFLLALLLLALGTGISALSAYVATRKYLKMSLDDLY